jgi:hypothetical protein
MFTDGTMARDVELHWEGLACSAQIMKPPGKRWPEVLHVAHPKREDWVLEFRPKNGTPGSRVYTCVREGPPDTDLPHIYAQRNDDGTFTIRDPTRRDKSLDGTIVEGEDGIRELVTGGNAMVTIQDPVLLGSVAMDVKPTPQTDRSGAVGGALDVDSIPAITRPRIINTVPGAPRV